MSAPSNSRPFTAEIVSTEGWDLHNTAPKLFSFDMRTGAVNWELETLETATVSLAGGGAVLADNAGNYRIVDSAGATESSANLGVGAGAYAFGRFHSRDAAGTLKAVPWLPLNDSTAFAQGPRSMTSVGGEHGVFAKGHSVLVGSLRHVSIRMVPRNQKDWLNDPIWGSYFQRHQDVAGDLAFVTSGAGPVPEGGGCPNTHATLVAGLNRPADVSASPQHLQALPLWPRSEDETIGALLSKTRAFASTLDYECTPSPFSDGYNSNSFAHGLLDVTHLPIPTFPLISNYFGWEKPVPGSYFQF